jgi:hypothetical protein
MLDVYNIDVICFTHLCTIPLSLLTLMCFCFSGAWLLAFMQLLGKSSFLLFCIPSCFDIYGHVVGVASLLCVLWVYGTTLFKGLVYSLGWFQIFCCRRLCVYRLFDYSFWFPGRCRISRWC